MLPDKLNRTDFRWFVIRTQPRQENKLADMLARQQASTKNILEVYCPAHTAVRVRRDGKEESAALFTGFVFVLATRQVISEFLEQRFPEGVMLYDYSKKAQGRKADLLTIPEEQMRAFMDFNENYAGRLVVLERPYSDYAFNPKTGEPNEIVRVVDGPLAGREGYIARFRRDKRLVFQMKGLGKDSYFTVSLPNVWDFHVVRLHNTEADRLSVGTQKGRAVDALIGILQACGYGERTFSVLYEVIGRLVAKPSLVHLCQGFYKEGQQLLSRRLAQLSPEEAELVLNLVRYERDNPGYVKQHWSKLVLRPFLTPASGVEIEGGKEEAEFLHPDFMEIIRKVDITEEVYCPATEKSGTVTTAYYAHIGVLPSSPEGSPEQSFILFANWDAFLGEYFFTAGKANEKLVGGTTQAVRKEGADEERKEKLIESFRNYAPTLYNVLTDAGSSVKAVPCFTVGKETLNVMSVAATDLESGKNELIDTCVRICKEINATTHLAVWRRYLRTVWLHL